MGIAVFGFIIGTILGSFCQAAAERILRKETVGGRSYCPSCKKQLKWYDLFPVLSFIFLSGHCRYCKKRIPSSDLAVEISLGAIGAVALLSLLESWTLLVPFTWPAVLLLLKIVFIFFVISVLTIIFLTDIKSYLIPDKVIFPAVIITLIYLIGFNLLTSYQFYKEILDNPLNKYFLPPYSAYFTDQLIRLWSSFGLSLFSAFGASLFFLFLVIITKGKGMGLGDVKYVFFLGLVLGFPNIIVGIFSAFLIGALYSLVLIFLKKKSFGQIIPFGPFLSIGAFIALFFGDKLIKWYLFSF